MNPFRFQKIMHTNENMANGLFKEAMLKIILESEEKKRGKKLEELQEEMERHVLPIRELFEILVSIYRGFPHHTFKFHFIF